jgi:hypothetical protein
MSATLDTIKALVLAGKMRVSQHGLNELRDDGILLSEVVQGLHGAVVVEDYPGYAKGPCVLCMQRDRADRPLHILWGIAAQSRDAATIITAYRPDPDRWSDDFLARKPK